MATREPIYAFSIPSVADDLALKCRIYHPKDLGEQLHSHEDDHQGVRGAVIAHPYGPLGGCYDDPVVLAVAETLLDQGYVVGTFNFRGAADSEGRTSWSGKAESEDYVSFAGFLVYYLQTLGGGMPTYALETIPSMGDFDYHQHSFGNDTAFSNRTIQLALCGYSYGSLILARLPAVTTIVDRFEDAQTGTASAEIILRARTLAKQTANSLQELRSPSSPRGRQLKPDDAATSPRRSVGASPITVGGEESDPSTRRRSRDSRRSMDIVRKSIEAPHRIKAHMKGSRSPAKPDSRSSHTPQTPMSGQYSSRPNVTPYYLAISPVLLPFTNQLCPPGPPSILPGLRKSTGAENEVGSCFLKNPTLAVFGSSDSFTASRRLKTWAEKMSRQSKSEFQWQEIAGAGHFWHEPGVMEALQARVVEWIKSSQTD